MYKQQQPLRFNTSTWQELKYKYRVKCGLCLIYWLFTSRQVGFKHFTVLVLLKRF